jgi:hypothetical protein
MVPTFASAELNRLLQLEMAEGSYGSSEDALLAGLQTLREGRAFRAKLADRLSSFEDGRSVTLNGDEELEQFLNSIDAEVDAELRSAPRSNA